MIERGSVMQSMVYNPYATGNPAMTVRGFAEAPRIVQSIISDFCCATKIVGSRSLAIELAMSKYKGGADFVKGWMVDEAYALACGGGVEYEWEYE